MKRMLVLLLFVITSLLYSLTLEQKRMLYEETHARRVKLYSMELMKGLKKGGFFWTRKRATRSDSDIRGYSFTDCNLNNKNLNGINLSFADLRRCSLVNTKLKNAYLRRTGFDRCVLFNTDFSYSNLYNARFIFLWYSVWPRYYARFEYCNFFKANMKKHVLKTAKLKAVILKKQI